MPHRIATAHRYTKNRGYVQSVEFYDDGTYKVVERERYSDGTCGKAKQVPFSARDLIAPFDYAYYNHDGIDVYKSGRYIPLK